MNSAKILEDVKTIAIVGISANPDRPSYGVAQYLNNFFEIIPVNPSIDRWMDKKCYANLSEVPVKIDLVNIFRRSDEVAPIVEEVIKLSIPKIWMQLGVIDVTSANKAKQIGIQVIMDECIAVVHRINNK